MDNIRRLRQLFLYAGIDREDYIKVLPDIRRENQVLLKVFTQIAAVSFFLLFVASIVTQGFATINASTYLLNMAEMLVILFCTKFVLPKYPAIVMVFVYIFEILLYVFGMYVSMLHAEKPAVSAVAFLLVSPLLFYDRPVRLSAMIAAVVALFSGIAIRFKTPEVAENDIWNMVTFGLVALAITTFIMSVKIRSLTQSRQIKFLSETDLLTGVKNRNAYENQLEGYAEGYTERLTCVYADVNGLHEMNNKHGHDAGDRMLCAVADEMVALFTPEHTYRIGGDEFVGLVVDGETQDLPAQVDLMQQSLNAQGYHVSFGIATHDKTQGEISVRDLVNEAEATMFAAKREFYLQAGNDRRSR